MENITRTYIASIEYAVNNPENIRLYHGGTHFLRENLFNFGFENVDTTIWDCSEEDKVYFYEFKRFAKSEGTKNEEFKYVQYSVLERANESGQIQEAILENPGRYTYVFEFVLPREAERYIDVDDSCENMDTCGAVQMDRDVINMFITLGKCTVNVYKYDFFPKMSYFYIAGLTQNPNASDFFDNLPPVERQAIEAINDTDTYLIYDEIILGACPEFDVCHGQLDPKHYQD